MCAPMRNTTNAPSKKNNRPQGKPAVAPFAEFDDVAKCIPLCIYTLSDFAALAFNSSFGTFGNGQTAHVDAFGDFARKNNLDVFDQH